MPVTNCSLISRTTARVLIALFCASSICSPQPGASQSKQSKIGAFGPTFWLLDQNGNDAWDGQSIDGFYQFHDSDPGKMPVHGDWNGTGTTKIGVYKDG